VTNAVASRILFDGRKAKAVEFQCEGKNYSRSYKRTEHFSRAWAFRVLDMLEIGENPQDHPVTLSDFKLKPGFTTLGMMIS